MYTKKYRLHNTRLRKTTLHYPTLPMRLEKRASSTKTQNPKRLFSPKSANTKILQQHP